MDTVNKLCSDFRQKHTNIIMEKFGDQCLIIKSATQAPFKNSCKSYKYLKENII